MQAKTWLPEFVDKLPKILFLDPLGAFLTGNTHPEPVEYKFEDVVKQSGHSCPTIASAYGIVLEAMSYLYGEDEIPVRGDIKVLCPHDPTVGGIGPMSQAISFLTGAAPESGFQGIGGNFRRKDLMEFTHQNDPNAIFIFTRTDTGKKVGIVFHSAKIPQNPELSLLLSKCVQGVASEQERETFGEIWQSRVRFILEKKEDRKKLFEPIFYD